MKKIYSLIVAALIFSTNATAQNPSFSWAKQIGGTGSDRGNSITTDASGNVLSLGRFNVTADFDPGAGTFTMATLGNDDIWITKLDAAGNFIWAKQITGTGGALCKNGNTIATDASGNVYFTGYFNGQKDFDPGVGTFNLTSLGTYDIFICKLDPNGNFVWAKRMGAAAGNNNPFAIAIDASNNVFTTGYFVGTVDFDPNAGVSNLISVGSSDIFISKLDANGNFLMARSMGGSVNDGAYNIKTDAGGNIYTTGSFAGTADFDPGAGVSNLVSSGNIDMFVSKLNSSGNFVWAKKIGGTSFEYGSALGVDASGNVYTVGDFQGTVDFDPGAGVFNQTSAGFEDIFISKLDMNGNYIWAKQFGSTGVDYPTSMILDNNANIYSTGYFNLTVDFDPNAGVSNLTSAGLEDVFISKIDPNGNYLWSGKIGGTGSESANSIMVTSTDLYLIGLFSSTSDFDAGAGTFNMTPFGSDDVFITKYSVCTIPAQPTSISGLNSICAGAGATSYSIATVVGATSYTWSLPGGWSGTSATNTISATPGTTGIFTVTASNGCGTSPQQTLNVTVNPLPTITVNSGSICSGSSFTMVAGGANTYTFSSGPVVSPTITSSYSVTGTSTAGCVSTSAAISNVTVVTTPTANASTSQTITCANPTVSLNGSGVTTYTWSGPGIVSGGNSATPLVNVAGTYSLVGSTGGCTSNTSTVSLTSNTTAPTLSISVTNTSVCSGFSVGLTASGANTYSWSTGSNSVTISVSPTLTTIYNVSGTLTINGCTNSANTSITVNPLPTINASTTNTLICIGQSATITASGASTYTFNPGGAGTNITVSPTVTANYTITGTDANGCTNSTAFTQSVSTCAGIVTLSGVEGQISVFPNPFNGKITIVTSSGVETPVQIFNALGSLIYSSQIKEKTEVDLNDQSNGIYFIRIGSVTKKIIKN